MLHQELPLDTRPILTLVLRMVCQSSTMGTHSSSSITGRARRPQQARTAAPPSAYDGHTKSKRRAQQLHRARTTATPKVKGAHSSSTERVRRPQHKKVRTAARRSAYNGHNRRAQQLHRARTTATRTGAHSSSTERVRRPSQQQKRRAQQLHRVRTTAKTIGAHSSSTERVRRPQQARTAARPSTYDDLILKRASQLQVSIRPDIV